MFYKSLKAEEPTSKLISWASTGLIIFISSFIWSPSRDGLDAVYLLAFFLPIFFLLIRNKFSLIEYGGLFTVSALAYAGYSLLSSLWGSGGFSFLLIQFFVISFWLIGTSWLMSNVTINLDSLLNSLIVIGSIVSVITVISFYQTGYQNGYHLEVRLSCWCSARNPNLLGGLYGVLALLSYIKLLEAKGRYFYIYGLATAILLLPLIFSQSRSALLSFFVTALAACIVFKPTIKVWALKLLLTLPALVILFFLADVHQILINRFSSIGSRDQIWEFVLNKISDHFIFGIGMSSDTKIQIPNMEILNHAHNAWLDIFYRTGLVGFILVLTHFLLLLINIPRTRMHRTLLLWLIYGAILSIFDSRGFFWEIDTKWFFYWVPAGLLAGLIVSERKIDNVKRSPTRTPA